MGTLKGGATLRLTEEDVVYSEDPDVTVPPHLAGCGWVPQGECQDRVGADVLRIRAMTDAEKTRARDLWARSGEASMNAFTVKCIVIRVNRWDVKKHPEKVAAWIAAATQQQPIMTDLLARRGDAITMGTDPAAGYPFARRTLGYPEPEAKEVGPDEGGESKSDG